MGPPRGIFGIPHELLSSPDEWAALGIGLLAVIAGAILVHRRR